MARSAMAPLEQGPPPTTMNSSTTPEQLRSSTAPLPAAPATPSERQRTLPSKTPGSSSASSLPGKQLHTPGPKTPGGTTTSCTSDPALFAIVKVHTAKCTECDKRNLDTMRRCPGCTFQVCKPCYERREREGRGLMHGNLMSSARTPATQRTVRRKPLGTMSTPKVAEVEKMEAADEQVEAGVVHGKDKQPTISTPKRQAKKRPLKKKRDVEDTPTEESSSDNDFLPESPSSMPTKRRRTALNLDNTASPKPSKTPKRATRKLIPASTASTNRTPSPTRSESIMEPRPSQGVRVGDLSMETLMHTYGVNTAENPYQEHLLARRTPVMSNPTILIPDIIKRGFRPRRSVEQIQGNIQENVLKGLEAKRKQAEEEAASNTVRTFVEAEVAKHQEQAALDEDDKEALFDTMKVEARKWCTHTFGRLDLETQKKVRRGLDMRLDMVGQDLKEQLAVQMEACATSKLKELEEERKL